MAVRDAVNRTSRKPFSWGGLAGYRQLEAIGEALDGVSGEETETAYLHRLSFQINRTLEKNRILAQDLREAHAWLIQIAQCLRYPSASSVVSTPEAVISANGVVVLTGQQVRNEMEDLLKQFHPDLKGQPAQAELYYAWRRLWKTCGKELLPCYDIPGLSPDNLKLEALFGKQRRHQRRITGRKSTQELREFGQYQVLFIAENEEELLQHLRHVPLVEYKANLRRLAAAELPRQQLYRLHRNPSNMISRLLNQHADLRAALARNETLPSPQDPPQSVSLGPQPAHQEPLQTAAPSPSAKKPKAGLRYKAPLQSRLRKPREGSNRREFLRGTFATALGELLLMGERNPSVPPIALADLVVALRNAYQVSPDYQGTPGCTIDPWPGSQDPWHIQQVRVFGMPKVTMAARHIAIDLELKKVSAGILSLGEKVPSLYQLARGSFPLATGRRTRRKRWKPRIASARALRRLPPLAKQFAHVITQLLATDRSRHCAQLRNDFRVIELGQLLRFKRVPAQSLRYFLQDYPLAEVPVPAFVGGIRREERGEVVCDSRITERQVPGEKLVQSTERVKRYHFTSRGGVEAKVRLSPEQFIQERSGVLADLRRPGCGHRDPRLMPSCGRSKTDSGPVPQRPNPCLSRNGGVYSHHRMSTNMLHTSRP